MLRSDSADSMRAVAAISSALSVVAATARSLPFKLGAVAVLLSSHQSVRHDALTL